MILNGKEDHFGGRLITGYVKNVCTLHAWGSSKVFATRRVLAWSDDNWEALTDKDF